VNCKLAVFSRRVQVAYESPGSRQPCPLKWLDNFAMRNFTNDPIFDDTLPIADGLMELGARVPLERLQAAMEDWFRRKGYIAKDQKLVITEAMTSESSK